MKDMYTKPIADLNTMNDLKDKKLFLLDLDGTIYIDDILFDGVPKFLKHVKETGGKYIFLTNNSSKSIEQYIDKFSRLGIKTEANDFLSSSMATIVYLKKRNYKKIYVFGTKAFREQLSEEGLPITHTLEEDIDCLCMGFDTELTFKKLEEACILLYQGIDYIATNPDWICPTSFGSVPDCGSISQILYNATGRKPIFIGKPKPEMVELAMKRTGFGRKETVVIGDRLYTDIACGINAGVSTVFVLSGEGKREDIETSDIRPEFVANNIKELYYALKKSVKNKC